MLKNLTFSADDALIQRARARAAVENRTLNAAFREWLTRYAGAERNLEAYKDIMARLAYVMPTGVPVDGERQAP